MKIIQMLFKFFSYKKVSLVLFALMAFTLFSSVGEVRPGYEITLFKVIFSVLFWVGVWGMGYFSAPRTK